MNNISGTSIFSLVSQLPYKKWWFWLILAVLIRLVVMTYDSIRPVGYDPQALGFASEEAMNAAFVKGYHTRQKMEEMERFYNEPSSSVQSQKITNTGGDK